MFLLEGDRVGRSRGVGGGEVEEGGGERVNFSVDHLWLVYQKIFHPIFWIMVVRDAPLTARCAIERTGFYQIPFWPPL